MQFDVIVVGAGLVGASLAIALQSADVSVALVDSEPPRRVGLGASWDSRVYAISPGNASWLADLQVWRQVRPERVARVESMLIYGDDARGHLEFSAYDAGMRELAYIVENRNLQDALGQALENSAHVKLYRPARCASVEWHSDHAQLTLEDGSELSTHLIVGADGADSWVREHAGIVAASHDYRQLGVVANFDVERPHEDVAFQWFRHDGVLALLPLPGERVSMVWSAPQARADELLSASSDDLCEQVFNASDGVLGRFELITAAAAFPLKRLRVERLVEPRAALVGDAAHSVHPLAGQGVNLGLRDARSLAAVLTRRGPRRDCGDYTLLRRFERSRRGDILALDFTTDGLEKLFGSRAASLARLRNFGLSLVDAQPLAKNALIRRAAA